MTRTEMRAVLASGGTVLHKGKHIRNEKDLPSEADLAVDSGTEGEALRSYQAQIEKLIAEKEALEKSLVAKGEKKKSADVAVKAGPEKVTEVVHEKDDKVAAKK